MLSQIISIYQSAFVLGRMITDNVLVAFEIIHHMHHKTRGNNSEFALKIDISKAYDRVDWTCLRQIMLQMGFALEWVDLIMLCVITVSYHASVNGMEVGLIVPQ